MSLPFQVTANGIEITAPAGKNIIITADSGQTVTVTNASLVATVTGNVTGNVTGDVTGNLTATGAVAINKPGSFAMGTLSSANDTSGIALSSSKTKAFIVCADTGGVALTAGVNVRAGVSRMLVGTAISSGADISTYGHECLLKMIVSVNVGGNQGGVLGHLESAGTLTLTGSINVVKAGVASFVDLATGATIAASTVVSAFGVNPANFGTVTGRTAIVHVTNPFSGTWGSLFDLSGSQGIQGSAAGATQDKHGIIYIDAVKYTFPLYTA